MDVSCGHVEKKQRSTGELGGEGCPGRDSPRRAGVADVEVIVWSAETFGWSCHPVGREERPVELLRRSQTSSGLADVDGQASSGSIDIDNRTV